MIPENNDIYFHYTSAAPCSFGRLHIDVLSSHREWCCRRESTLGPIIQGDWYIASENARDAQYSYDQAVYHYNLGNYKLAYDNLMVAYNLKVDQAYANEDCWKAWAEVAYWIWAEGGLEIDQNMFNQMLVIALRDYPEMFHVWVWWLTVQDWSEQPTLSDAIRSSVAGVLDLFNRG